jgi:hypothetical protein
MRCMLDYYAYLALLYNLQQSSTFAGTMDFGLGGSFGRYFLASQSQAL